MKYRIALATYSGETIDLHFGRCTRFQVVEVTDNISWDYIDEIDTGIACIGECDHENISRVAEQLSSCKYVLASRIGLGAARILLNNGVKALEIENEIENAIEKLMAYDKVRSA